MSTTQDTTNGVGRKASGRRARRPLFAGYGRVSRVGGRDERLRSPELMTRLMRTFAEAERIELAEVVIELDVSGSRTDESAELERLVQLVEAGELDGIVVPKLDRLSRLKARQRVELVERIGDERLLSATESNDVSTPEGRFVRELFFSLARMEWERAAGNFERAKELAIASGVSIAKRAAFGLRHDETHRYVPAPKREVRTLVELFELRAAGGSYAEVADLFEQRTGRSTSTQTMSELLANRVYLGELRHGAYVNASAHKAIVPLELFEAAQATTAERRVERSWSGRRTTLLAGVARCEACGAGLTRSTSNRGASVVYRCPNRKCSARASIGLDVLDEYVVGAVLEEVGPAADELVELELELGHTGDRIVAEHRLEEARRVLVAWAADVEAELEDGAAYRAGLQAREQLVAKRERELVELGEATEVELARATVRGALDGSEAFDVDERRRLLAVVLDGVVVRKTPRAGAPASERVELFFAPATGARLEDATELVEQLAPAA